MKSFIPLTAATLATGIVGANAAFDINASNNLVMYWGQSSAGSEQSLGDYCQQTAGDVYVLSFIYEFGTGSSVPELNIGSCYDTFSGTDILTCPDIGSDIKTCQSLGKKVLVSLGGAVGTYGFTSDSQAESTADDLWNMYGGGSSDTRPFGDAIVDGFDLDIENNEPDYYPALVSQLRSHFDGASKDYYITAAPQCPYPDASVGLTLSSSQIDMIWIQFYNNYCSLSGSEFNWDTWQKFADDTSPNSDIKMFVGLPGSSSAAGSGYVDPSVVESTLQGISSANFGGIMLWDASQGFSNEVDGITYAQSMQNILDNLSGSDSGSSEETSSSVAAVPTSSSSSAVSPVETSSVIVDIASSTLGVQDKQVTVPATITTIATSAPSSTEFTTTTCITSILGTVTVTVSTSAKSTSTAASPSQTTAGSCSTEGETSCINGSYSVCNWGAWVLFDCPSGTVCSLGENGASCDFA